MREARWAFVLRVLRWLAVAIALIPGTAAQAVTKDITNQFTITRSGLALNRTTNTFDQTITFRNTAGGPVLAPIKVAVGIAPSSVTLANKAGVYDDGRPFVSPLAAGALLQSGGTLSFTLKFANPSRVTFTSVIQVLYSYEVPPPDAPSLLGVVATGSTSANLIGRINGAASPPITLQAESATTCVLGKLVGGTAVGGPLAVTPDDAGYFAVPVAGVKPGDFVAVKTTSPAASASSTCLVSSRDNDSWPKAFLLEGSAPVVGDLIDAPGKARWYKFAVTPGQRLEVKLSGLPADYDLAVFKDIGQAFASQFDPEAGPATSDLLKLTAEYAPSIFSPSIFSPSIFSPSIFSPDAYAPSIFSPSIFSPSIFSPSIFSPSIFSPSIFSPSIFSPSIFSPSIFSPSIFSPSIFSPSIFSKSEIAEAFSTAQMRSIVAVSATAGLSDEFAVVNTWNRTGHFYVRVAGRGGAFNTSVPFTLKVTKGVTTCAGVTDTVLTARPAVAASGLKTVIVTDSSKVALDAALPGAAGATLRNKLSAFATRSEISGVVVDVAGDGRVNTLRQQAASNPACPFAKNLVADEIKGIVDSYRTNPLQYVVIVGNDDAIPFFRSPDQSTIGQESGYVPPVQSNSPSEASLRLDFVLSQDRYGSKTTIALPWNDFPVPELAVGRLVEMAGEIAGLIDAYTAANAVVSPATSLVTGYDFLEDAATAVKAELDAGTGVAGDALITPNGKSPQDPASWKAADLRANLFGSRHDVIYLAGHFSANSALAADFATSVLTVELAASTNDFTNSLVFSAGCHSGYNLVDGDAIPGVTLPLDWAQAFARKKATLIAGTGYQYGDTDFLEYSERLYNNFARQLRAGSAGTAIPVGAALVQAKLAYLAATPDIRGLHEKALLQATLFGLPMLGVNMPAGREPVGGTSGAIAPAVADDGPAAELGLASYDLNVAPTLTPRTQSLKNIKGGANIEAAWLSGPDGVVTKPGEPALPLAVVDVTPNDPRLVLRGVGYRGGTYEDAGPMYPFTGAPSTESRGVHVPFLSPVFYPTMMWTPNYFGALAGSGGTRLLVTPVQHRAANLVDGRSMQRKHTNVSLRLFYSGNLSRAALSDAPSIVSIDAQLDAGAIVFTALVVGDPAAAVHQVWVTYTGDLSNAWNSLDLDQCVRSGPTNSLPLACGATEDSRLWKGRLGSPPANPKYLVQAVSGVGLVARNDNLGAYFGIATATPAATALALVSPPSSATIGDNVNVTAKLSYAGGVAIAGKMVAVGAGGVSQLGTTGTDGSVTVKLPIVAVGSQQIVAAFAGDDAFLPSSASSPLSVTKATATTTVLPPSAGVAGINIAGALGGTSTAPQQVPVAFAVVGPSGTTTIWSITDNVGNAMLQGPSGLSAGSYTVVSASFGGDGTYAPTTIVFPTPQQFTVPKTNQSIAFDALADKVVGDPDFQVSATAEPSHLAVTFGASGSCTVAGNTVHLTGPGSCTITADQPGDSNYNAAAQVVRSFAIVVPPTVVSLVRAVPNPTMSDSVDYTVTFSENVSNVTPGNFAVTTGGALSAPFVANVAGAGTTWTVTVNTGRGTGSLHLDAVNGTGIVTVSGIALGGLPFVGETYQVDKGGTVLGAGEGQPVAGFGTGGYALFGDVQISTAPGRIRVRSNGQIVAAGGTACTPNVNPLAPDFAYCTLQLARYSASGVPDATFGPNGRVVTAVTNIQPELNFSFNSDGTILVRGLRYNGTRDVPYVAKFTGAGAADASFGTAGIVNLTSLPVDFGILGSVVDASGRILIVATTPDTGTGEREDIFVTRLTSSGVTDETFGTGGVAQFALSTVDNRSDRGTTLDVQPDGRIVIGGRTKVTAGLGYDFLLMRLSDTGAPDPSFGTGGIVTTRFPASTGNNLGRRLVLQPDGKIALIGTVVVGAANQCGIARFNSNGTLDPGFGTGGQVLVPVSVGCFYVNQQPDGKLVVSANDAVGDVTYGTFIRLLLDGTLDAGFGDGGLQDISNFGTPTRVAFTASGNLVTGLTIQDPTDGVQKSYVVELTTTLTGPWVAQTITFNALPDRAYGETFVLSATASSGLPVSYAASGACSVAGSQVETNGVGSCTITASQAGDATWFAATSMQQSFNIAAASQSIAFGPAPSGVAAGQPLVMVSATSASPTAAPTTNPIAFSSLTPSVCTVGGIGGASLTLLTAGTCTIAADQVGEANYSGAPQATQSFTVGATGTLPTTYTVSNLNDSGAGSLRDAIAQANLNPGPDIVNFQGGLTGTIVLTSGQIQISGPLSIVGPGAGVITIDGNGVLNGTPWSRVFSIYAVDVACPTLDVANDYLVSISGLRLINGRNKNPGGSGGAISTIHSLALDSVVIEDSAARSGGGVMFLIQHPGQSLTITNSTFLNNRATELVPPTGVTNVSGGAVYVVERCTNAQDLPYTQPVSVSISNSEFRGNLAQPTTLGGRGGAIRSYSLADIAITDTIIVDNHVDAPVSPVPGFNFHGGGFDGTAKSLRIERSEIAENSAYDPNPANDLTRSGGLHLYHDAVDRQGSGDAMGVRIVNSTISGNASTATAGAMLAFGNVALELVNSTVADNLAAANRTGGIVVSQGATYPVSASGTARPTLRLVSSIAANNSSNGGDIAASINNFANFTFHASRSMIERLCPTPNCVLFMTGTDNVIAPPDPGLDVLARNPVPPGTARMRTHALLPGSPAINAGSNPLGLTTDQRGATFPRTIGAAPDMGAYESATP